MTLNDIFKEQGFLAVAPFNVERKKNVYYSTISTDLTAFKQNKNSIYAQFPERISKADFEQIKFVYEKIVEDDGMMKEISEIISYALNELNHSIHEGKEIYDFSTKIIDSVKEKYGIKLEREVNII